MSSARELSEKAAKEATWGIVPGPFTALVRALTAEIEANSHRLARLPWPSEIGDAEPRLISAIEASERINSASKDLRSALSAYAHKIHTPRPRVGAIAEAQGTSTQGLLRRYTNVTEDAVRSLIEGNATSEQLTAAFTSLTPDIANRVLDSARGQTGIESGPLVFPGTPTPKTQTTSKL